MAKSIKNSRVLKQITDRLGSGASSLKLKKFAEIYFHGTPDRELKNIRQGSESHAKQSYENFLTWNGKAQVKVFNPDYTHYTVAEIQIADQPFLVDTVWGELHRRGFEIHHTFHPVIAVARDKNCKAKEFNLDFKKVKGKAKFESFIHVEFDYQASKEELLAIKQGLLDVLQHAYNVSEDFVMMRSRMDEIFANKDIKLAKEEKLFLEWILDNNFIFLGYRHYDITRKSRVVSMKITKGKGLGILQNDKDSSLYKSTKLKDLPTNMQDYISNKESLTLTKALTKSPVHRVVDMDYIGIKEVNSKGQIIGEHRFLGAFTSRAYTSNPREIPLVRKKIDKVLAKTSYFSERTHNSKALMNILETYPRDELFQISVDDLHRISLGILNLKERQQVRLFVRRSTHERLVTAMVFIPRDRMTSGLRKKVVNIISEAYNAEDVEYMTTLGESLLARIFMKIRCCPPEPPEISDDLVENRLIEVARSWSDALNVSLCEKFGERQGHKFFKNYCSAFRVGYQENTKIEIAVEDIENAEKVLAGKDFSIAISSDEDGNSHLKVFNLGQRINLSEIMPLFNNMGLKITDENPTCIRKDGEHIVWLHDFGVGYKNTPYCKTLIESESRVANALEALWHGELENDSLNSLIVSGGLDTRQVVILRALVAYLQQIYPRYSREYMRNTLINHPNIANKLLELFDARFNPNLSKTERGKQQDVLMKKVTALLETVSVLDEDIIIRRVLNIIQAMVRTNVWQRKEYTDPLAFKICSSDIEDLVKPHPLFEIFVYHNSVEGVHLRGGMVARGGLRWSDRPADFRTEVLGLMKAQMTKNAVIVPVGSKGGFVLKQAPCDLKNMEACDRDALSRSVENAYKTFVGSLLSITDNVEAGKTLYPKNVVRYDDDDVYLVVAADKGTATFSDIANNLAINADYWAKSKQKGFWLGDAFASGGSNGYDHKKMGITARGAWECVKYHFMELGKDIQNKDFTVVGIGDMAGDVFGNGMLLSKHIKLQAAFNHRHIFLDPNPNTAKSWKERERMFKTPRITWADYDKKLISKGGGVFNRNAKSIEISPEIGKMLGISAGKVTPDILIKAILSMEVDLLWNGGIGTFFKSNQENHSQVGDKANDAIRLNAREIKAKVVGEGGNLGFTQLSRIEYAMQGGKINTDSIDNSAGVNCSDNEVNIKILLNAVQEDSKNKLNDTARNKLLAEMTADVGLLSLEANYYQSQILSIAQEVSRKL